MGNSENRAPSVPADVATCVETHAQKNRHQVSLSNTKRKQTIKGTGALNSVCCLHAAVDSKTCVLQGTNEATRLTSLICTGRSRLGTLQSPCMRLQKTRTHTHTSVMRLRKSSPIPLQHGAADTTAMQLSNQNTPHNATRHVTKLRHTKQTHTHTHTNMPAHKPYNTTLLRERHYVAENTLSYDEHKTNTTYTKIAKLRRGVRDKNNGKEATLRRGQEKN